jgi:hypothetical protein
MLAIFLEQGVYDAKVVANVDGEVGMQRGLGTLLCKDR